MLFMNTPSEEDRDALPGLFLYNRSMEYTKQGYIDVARLRKKDHSIYKFIVGARGIGKTFGFLKDYLDSYEKTGRKLVYMRRTQAQVDLIKTPDFNPFLALERVLGDEYKFTLKNINKNITGVYKTHFDAKNGKWDSSGSPVCYIMALSTIANIRGFSGSDIGCIIYDEFIGENHEKPIRSEGTAFLNAIETISRNRELEGEDPVEVVCLSNSNQLANPIFVELKLVTICEKALNKGKDEIRIPERSISIYMLHDSPISKKKKQTSLYKLAGDDSSFTRMSIENDFTKEYFGMVKSMKLTDFRPICQVGELCIYKHKSQRRWYVTEHVSGKPEKYDGSDIEIKRWTNDYYYLKLAYLNRHVYFENYIDQVLFENYLKI